MPGKIIRVTTVEARVELGDEEKQTEFERIISEMISEVGEPASAPAAEPEPITGCIDAADCRVTNVE